MRINKAAFKKVTLFLSIAMLMSMAMGCTALRPLSAVPSDKQVPLFIPPTLMSVITSTPTPDLTDPLNSQVKDCKNGLEYISDLTYPDGTFVKPGESLDKQWKVKNNGTCNWNETYSLRLISGPDLGAVDPQSITPLRAGVEGTIQIVFTAPTEPGNYISTWQAFDPDGKPFGEYFSIEINVVQG
jgi:hypothetical protein